MKARLLQIALIFGFWTTVQSALAQPANRWPTLPTSGNLFQSATVLSPSTVRTTENLLKQHERLTGERILIVLSPWNDSKRNSDVKEIARALAVQWKIDTTRKGATVLLLVQEESDNQLSLAYLPGIGLSKSQIASNSEVRDLTLTLKQLPDPRDWGRITETILIWTLQSLTSPLLENPEALTIHKTKPPLSFQEPKKTFTIVTFVSPILVFIGLFILFKAIQLGLRPQILVGSRRVIRFTLLDQIHEKLKALPFFQAKKLDPKPNPIWIEILKGDDS